MYEVLVGSIDCNRIAVHKGAQTFIDASKASYDSITGLYMPMPPKHAGSLRTFSESLGACWPVIEGRNFDELVSSIG